MKHLRIFLFLFCFAKGVTAQVTPYDYLAPIKDPSQMVLGVDTASGKADTAFIRGNQTYYNFTLIPFADIGGGSGGGRNYQVADSAALEASEFPLNSLVFVQDEPRVYQVKSTSPSDYNSGNPDGYAVFEDNAGNFPRLVPIENIFKVE